MKLEVSEQFVKEAHQSACQDWKERIEKEFPSLFDVKWEKGKWYKLTWDNGQATAYVNSDGTKDCRTNGTKGFGIRNGGIWDNDYEGLWGGSNDVKKELMLPQEVESMLWKEAEKRGFKEGVKYISLCTDKENTIKNGLFLYENNGDFSLIDTSSHSGNFIFHDAKWAELVDPNKEIKEQISRLEKELKELKDKVSPKQDIGW